MAERDLIQQLDQAVDAMLFHAEIAAADPEVTALLQIAAAVRGLPDEEFRTRLKAELIQRAMTERETLPVNWIPEGFHTVTPYLHPAGAAKLIDFMKQAFDAKEMGIYRRPDGSVMHAAVKIGDSILEMGEPEKEPKPMPVALHLYVKDADAIYQRALQAGGTSLHDLVDQEYGDREGSVRDPLGNNWYIATHQGADYIPQGLGSVTPYLHPRGAAKLIDFLKRAFGAEEAQRAESPDGTVVHAKIKIGDSIVEMGEAHGEWQPMPAALHVYVKDVDAAYKRALEAGATSLMGDPKDQPYGDRVAGVTDPFGNIWYLATHIKDVVM